MPRDTDRIIEIAANTEKFLKSALVDLIEAGANPHTYTHWVEALKGVDHAVITLDNPGGLIISTIETVESESSADQIRAIAQEVIEEAFDKALKGAVRT